MKFGQYSIRVVAFNDNGAGISTEESTVRTFSDCKCGDICGGRGGYTYY